MHIYFRTAVIINKYSENALPRNANISMGINFDRRQYQAFKAISSLISLLFKKIVVTN